MLKKLIILPVIAVMLASAPSAQALTRINGGSVDTFFENLASVEAMDVDIDADMMFFADGEDEPFAMNADIDLVWSDERNDEYDLVLTASDAYGEETFEGSAIVTWDRVYVFDGTSWSFAQSYEAADDAVGLMEEASALELSAAVKELFAAEVISFRPTGVDFVNNTFTTQYSYFIDTDALVDYLVDQGDVEEANAEEMRAYLDEHVVMNGQFWVDSREMLPVKMTFIAEIEEEGEQVATLDVTVSFNSFNEEPDIQEPKEATDLGEYFDRSTIGDSMTATAVDIASSVEVLEDVYDVDQLHDEEVSEEGEEKDVDPSTLDSDGDGYNDYTEMVNGYNPYGPGILDSDGDGLTDYFEQTIHWSDPYDADSDGDGYDDGVEIANGYDPNGTGRW